MQRRWKLVGFVQDRKIALDGCRQATDCVVIYYYRLAILAVACDNTPGIRKKRHVAKRI